MRVWLYRALQAAHGSYMLSARWPVGEDSWLKFVVVSKTERGRDAALAMLRTLRIDTTQATLAQAHPSSVCPTFSNRLTEDDSSVTVDRVTFTVPIRATRVVVPGTPPLPSPPAIGPPTMFNFTVLPSPGWQLTATHQRTIVGPWLWCTMTVAGQRMDVQVDTLPHLGRVGQTSIMAAFLQLATNRLLFIRASTNGATHDQPDSGGVSLLFSVLHSARFAGSPSR